MVRICPANWITVVDHGRQGGDLPEPVEPTISTRPRFSMTSLLSSDGSPKFLYLRDLAFDIRITMPHFAALAEDVGRKPPTREGMAKFDSTGAQILDLVVFHDGIGDSSPAAGSDRLVCQPAGRHRHLDVDGCPHVEEQIGGVLIHHEFEVRRNIISVSLIARFKSGNIGPINDPRRRRTTRLSYAIKTGFILPD